MIRIVPSAAANLEHGPVIGRPFGAVASVTCRLTSLTHSTYFMIDGLR